MYRWRRLTEEQRRKALRERQLKQRPLHSPPHRNSGRTFYLITAACYEHAPLIGHSLTRMNDFAETLLDTLESNANAVHAWVVLPNHYHVLVSSPKILTVLKTLGRLHGRTSFHWNGEETARGRKVWCNAAETVMKSDAHFHATLNYIHHNPVKHGYVEKWTDWPWSSAPEYLQGKGHDEAARLWKAFPIDGYGKGWDDAEL